ncbi:EamA-like transporter family protein [Candidatus Hepatincolaceae symbiont of Richtersius coronifer]
MMIWILFAALSLISYTAWGLLNGVVARNMDPYSGIFLSGIGYIISGIIALSLVGFKINFTSSTTAAVGSGIALGLATGIGGLFLLLSVKYGGNVSMIVVLTSLYPILTLLLNFSVFHVALTLPQIVGAILAVIAVALVTNSA